VLTRLEIDGFKNLLNFSIDFGPFTCIAGPNGVGKSNIFDAIRFLSLLTDNTLTEAALKVRGSATDSGDLRDLFYAGEAGHRDQIRIAAEMIISPDDIQDDFGRFAIPSSTFLRYEIRVGYESRSHDEPPTRLVLLHESLDYITQGEAATNLKFPHKLEFRNSVVSNKRRAGAYISSTRSKDEQTEIHVHQDGGAKGLTQVAPAFSAPRTIVGTSNNSATPTILAARREMQRWQILALEPSAMREPDRGAHAMSDFAVASNGGHLPLTVQRMELASALANRGGSATVSAEIVARISRLVPIRELRIDEDKARRILTLQVRENGSINWLPVSSLSDGTLRFLALAILAQDRIAPGLVCIEEPENGIHPAKMEEVLNLLRDIAIDPELPPDSDNPLRQVIVATHSPTLVQLIHSQSKGDLVFAMSALVRGATGKPEQTVRCLPMNGTWRCEESQLGVGLSMVLTYLALPPGAQLSLLDLTA
jgi:predicted ATPase